MARNLQPSVGDTVKLSSGTVVKVTKLLTNDRFEYEYKGRIYTDGYFANIAEIVS